LPDARADPFPEELTVEPMMLRERVLRAACALVVVLGVSLLSGCRLIPEKEKDPKDQEKTEKWSEPEIDPALAESRAVPKGDVADLWNDPVFKRQFVAGYGVSSDVEPRVSPDEVKVLEKIRPLMAQNLAGAEEALKREMKADSSATLDFTLGGIQFQQDKVPEALANYQRAVAKFPAFRRAWRNLGLIHVRAGRYDDAIRAFTRMIELGGGDGYAYGLLAYAYAAKEDFQPAEAAYRSAMLLQPDNAEWRLGLTRSVYKQEKFADAAALLDILVARYPERAEFWMLQANCYVGMKQPLRAAENLEVVDRLGKSTVDSLFLLGDLYAGENLMDLAVGAYERAVDLDAAQPLSRPLRAAEILTQKGANAQAARLVAHLKKSRGESLEPDDARRLLKLEARLRMAEGEGTEETAKILEEILRIDPLDGDALMLLGQHYQKQDQPEKAILYLERAAGLEAFEAEAKVRIAQILVGMGRHADALPLLRRAQEIKPRESVARYLEQVERLARQRGVETRPRTESRPR
jgi:tetratricopeptide (TPR) repeat protein